MGENLKIAMVEEATGKGYEVRIGTYMGKKRGTGGGYPTRPHHCERNGVGFQGDHDRALSGSETT